MTKSIELQKPALIQFFWRWHTSNQTIRRVWRSDWANDQFEIMSSMEFDNLKHFAKKFGFPLNEVED